MFQNILPPFTLTHRGGSHALPRQFVSGPQGRKFGQKCSKSLDLYAGHTHIHAILFIRCSSRLGNSIISEKGVKLSFVSYCL